MVGTAGTPTPRGLAATYERNRQPDPTAFLGPWVLSLTIHSNVLESLGGGPGRVIRIDNGPVAWMAARIPAGTRFAFAD